MTELKPAAQHTRDFELSAELRIYIALLLELHDRGLRLAEAMPGPVTVKSIGKAFTVSPKPSVLPMEVPLYVSETTVIDGAE